MVAVEESATADVSVKVMTAPEGVDTDAPVKLETIEDPLLGVSMTWTVLGTAPVSL